MEPLNNSVKESGSDSGREEESKEHGHSNTKSVETCSSSAQISAQNKIQYSDYLRESSNQTIKEQSDEEKEQSDKSKDNDQKAESKEEEKKKEEKEIEKETPVPLKIRKSIHSTEPPSKRYRDSSQSIRESRNADNQEIPHSPSEDEEVKDKGKNVQATSTSLQARSTASRTESESQTSSDKEEFKDTANTFLIEMREEFITMILSKDRSQWEESVEYANKELEEFKKIKKYSLELISIKEIEDRDSFHKRDDKFDPDEPQIGYCFVPRRHSFTHQEPKIKHLGEQIKSLASCKNETRTKYYEPEPPSVSLYKNYSKYSLPSLANYETISQPNRDDPLRSILEDQYFDFAMDASVGNRNTCDVWYLSEVNGEVDMSILDSEGKCLKWGRQIMIPMANFRNKIAQRRIENDLKGIETFLSRGTSEESDNPDLLSYAKYGLERNITEELELERNQTPPYDGIKTQRNITTQFTVSFSDSFSSLKFLSKANLTLSNCDKLKLILDTENIEELKTLIKVFPRHLNRLYIHWQCKEVDAAVVLDLIAPICKFIEKEIRFYGFRLYSDNFIRSLNAFRHVSDKIWFENWSIDIPEYKFIHEGAAEPKHKAICFVDCLQMSNWHSSTKQIQRLVFAFEKLGFSKQKIYIKENPTVISFDRIAKTIKVLKRTATNICLFDLDIELQINKYRAYG